MNENGDLPILETAEDLYEHAPCGYLSTRSDGRIIRVNHTFCRWTGFEREDLLRVRFHELLAMGSRLFHETHIAPLLRVEGSVREIACELRTAEGTLLSVLLNATSRRVTSPGGPTEPMTSSRDPAGPLHSAASHTIVRYMVLDATERRRYEQELLEARRRAEAALKRVEELESLLPMCAWCRRLQSGVGRWVRLEEYLLSSGTKVTHGICDQCTRQMEI
jgi:PAS domain S-box-containing protein